MILSRTHRARAPPPERRTLSLSVQIGLLLALATAFASVLGFLFKHRGAVASPEVTMSAPIRSSLQLFRSPTYNLGLVVATAGWGLHVRASLERDDPTFLECQRARVAVGAPCSDTPPLLPRFPLPIRQVGSPRCPPVPPS